LNLSPRYGWVINVTPRPLYPRKRTNTRCSGCWVGFRASLNGYGKRASIGIQSPNRPTCSELIYWLRYPSVHNFSTARNKTLSSVMLEDTISTRVPLAVFMLFLLSIAKRTVKFLNIARSHIESTTYKNGSVVRFPWSEILKI
jgi:hypothetical protein